MRVKKQLCCGSFFNDPKAHVHESFSSACLFDMWKDYRKKRKGGRVVSLWVLMNHETSLGLTTSIMVSDNLLDR